MSPRRKLIDGLFRWRELLLRHGVDPFDRLYLRATGRSGWPPYSLRRHVGPPSKFALAGRQTEEWIERFGLLEKNASVLDIGCGCGAMVPAFARRLGERSRYLGFDVHPPSIAYCRKAFAGDPRFRFELAEVSSPYGASHGPEVERYRFPAAAESCDFVLAKSVFTHLQEAAARHYLAEIARVLRPGGRALISAFLFTLPAGDARRALPHPAAPEALVRWRLAAKPEAAIGFEGALFQRWIAEAGLGVEHFVPVFWPGRASVETGQDLLVLAKA